MFLQFFLLHSIFLTYLNLIQTPFSFKLVLVQYSKNIWKLVYLPIWLLYFWIANRKGFRFLQITIFTELKLGKKVFSFVLEGEWRGQAVSVEDCHYKGREFESPCRPSFFWTKNVSWSGNEECVIAKWSGTCKTRRSREGKTTKAIVSGMVTRETVWFVSKTIKWSTPSKGTTWCEKN